MKTVILTANMRVGFGEAAKEGVVGVYEVPDEWQFGQAVAKVSARLNRGKWLGPGERGMVIRERLSKMGYVPITATTQFVSAF